MNSTGDVRKVFEKVLALVYLSFVIYITLIMGRNYQKAGPHKISLVPLGTKIRYLENFTQIPVNQKKFIIKEMVGNLLLFMPFHWSIDTLTGNKNKRLYIVFFITMSVFLIESIQYFFNIGTFDIDDFILNISGGIAGIFIFKILQKTKAVNEDSDIWH